MELLEVIRGSGCLEWSVAEPVHDLVDMIDELIVLLAWVRIVKSQVRVTSMSFSDFKVEADGLGVTDMEVAIRLRWESRVDLTSSEGTVLG